MTRDRRTWRSGAWAIFVSAAMLMSPTGAPPRAAEQETFSGLQVPRFVSLKSDRVNLRAGPSNDYPIKHVFVRRGLPLEITGETKRWRRVRDMDGEEGWVWHDMLDGKRMLWVRGDGTEAPVLLRDAPNRNAPGVALVAPGVIGELEKCQGNWCLMAAGRIDGWIHKSQVFGVYPDEIVD